MPCRDAVDACRDGICTTQEEDKIALDDPDFWEKTLGKDALKQKKEIVDTTQRKAKQGDKEYVHNCNQCWINFHRKYDIILYRNLEKFFPKTLTRKLFGYYQWTEDASTSYSQFLDQMEKTYK